MNGFNCGSCGAFVEKYVPGDDIDCPRCGQWHNAFGQRVNYPMFDGPIAPSGFDPMDAGEVWDWE